MVLCALEVQHSATACVLNASFGCHASHGPIWVRDGCRGTFRCANATVSCGSYRSVRDVCSCRSSEAATGHRKAHAVSIGSGPVEALGGGIDEDDGRAIVRTARACTVALMLQQPTASGGVCERGVSYGCVDAASAEMWTSDGCSGLFQCQPAGAPRAIAIDCGGRAGRGVCSCVRHNGSEAAAAATVRWEPRTDVLLGILSASPRRRRALRCAFGRARWSAQALAHSARPVRAVFVVASAPEPPPQWANDVLVVNATDRVLSGTGSTFGTGAALIKQAHFLRYAATQPEPLVALADDDTFISLPALQFFASALQQAGRARAAASASSSAGDGGAGAPPLLLYAGLFEWYNWVPAELRSTGWGYTAGLAKWHAVNANCTTEAIDGPPPSAKACVGPFLFAKGPLAILSREAVRRVASSPTLWREAQRAQTISGARWPIQPDVQLGYLLATRVPRLLYVDIRPGSWHDRRSGAAYAPLQARRLLSAHRLPYVCWQSAIRAATRWESARAELDVAPVHTFPPWVAHSADQARAIATLLVYGRSARRRARQPQPQHDDDGDDDDGDDGDGEGPEGEADALVACNSSSALGFAGDTSCA